MGQEESVPKSRKRGRANAADDEPSRKRARVPVDYVSGCQPWLRVMDKGKSWLACGLMPIAQADEMYAWLKTIAFDDEKMFGNVPRQVKWFSDLPYEYSNQTKQPNAIPPQLSSFIGALRPQVIQTATQADASCIVVKSFLRDSMVLGGISVLAQLICEFVVDAPEPNGHLVNHYRTMDDSVMPHADDQPAIVPDTVIISSSFGAMRLFEMKHKAQEEHTMRISLPHGSVLLMGGECQRHWLHSIPKVRGCAPYQPRPDSFLCLAQERNLSQQSTKWLEKERTANATRHVDNVRRINITSRCMRLVAKPKRR